MRNRVRLKLIPQLKIYNLKIKEIISQTILLLTEDREYIEVMAKGALAEVFLSSEQNNLKLDIKKIKEFEFPIQGHLLREAIERVKGDLSGLSFKHVQDILANLDSSEKWELHLPDGILVSGIRGQLVIGREKLPVQKKKSYFYSLSIPGEIEIKELGKNLRATLLEEMEKNDNPQITFVDYSVLGKNLIVRSKSDGDKFCPLGMKGSKKLQDFFVDEKIAAEDRGSVPIVESGGKIIWVGGMRIDERAKVSKNTKKIVKLELL